MEEHVSIYQRSSKMDAHLSPDPKKKVMESEKIEPSTDIFQNSIFTAIKVLLISILLVTVGYILIALMPWYFMPISWIFLGACYALMHTISDECSRGSFTKIPIVNTIVGAIVSLPLLLPFESWRIQQLNFGNLEIFKKYESLANSWKWWLSSTQSWLNANFTFASSWIPGNRRRIVISLACLYVFVSIFFPALIRYTGVWGLCKFWLIPWLVHHVWVSSLMAQKFNLPISKDTRLRVSIVFPKESPLDFLKNFKLSQVNWIPALWITLTPIIALYGSFTTQLTTKTLVWSIVGYLMSGLGITVGYHRFFAHKSFSASNITKILILFCGTSAFQGSCIWWARDHRAHHRYVDTDKDPYNSKKGFFWSHVGWLLVKQNKAAVGKTDCDDLENDPILIFQEKYYLPLAIFSGIIFPVLVAGLGWGDWWGGFYFACIAKSVLVLQSTFCVNSLAHYVGEHTYTDAHTPRDCFAVSLVTFGEGYHNFHHEFPYDYRNGVKWFAYDPSKWTIWLLSLFGQTFDLKRFPDNEIKKGELQMMEKRIEREMKTVDWGKTKADLPAFALADVRRRVDEGSSLVIIDDYVVDVGEFIDVHPGGKAIIKAFFGKDATKAFTGQVYDHSNGAKNLVTTFRVGYIEK